MRRPHRAVGLAAALAIAVVIALVGACSDDDDGEAGVGTTTTTTASQATATSGAPGTQGSAPTSSAAAGPAGSGSGSAGCTGGDAQIPAGATTGEIADVDGDGRPDTAWLAGTASDGTRRLGIRTASGGGAVAEVDSASPVGLVLLVADVDQRPPVELLISDNRSVQLRAFADCQIQPVIGPDGAPYLFDLGVRGTGTGVGCIDTRQGRRLVGLNVISDDGTTVEWSRTVVALDGLQASHGETATGSFRRPRDDAAIDLLHAVSCGDLTIDQDGLRQPEP